MHCQVQKGPCMGMQCMMWSIVVYLVTLFSNLHLKMVEV